MTVAFVVTVGCRTNDDTGQDRPDPEPAPEVPANEGAWPMHVVDDRWRGANSTGPADANGDGLTDYVTNYEFDQRYVVSLHPPDGVDAREPWEHVDIVSRTAEPGRGSDTESAELVDVDGDGNLDVLGAQGGHPSQFFDGYEPGIRIFWGPDERDVTDAASWEDAGRFPATIEQGHYLTAEGHDVDGDGDTDVVAGGRTLFTNGRRAGIVWLEAPDRPSQRRDLGAWELHAIDPTTVGGHGFVWTDLDGDGDDDVVDANADFDTPEPQERVVWYEHPDDPEEEAQPWPRTVLYRSPDFYGKPQLVVEDLDGDGRIDITTTSQSRIVFLRGTAEPGQWEPAEIEKPPEIEGPSRTLEAGDVDGDGDPDLVGGLTHDQGQLPIGRAAVYWLENAGPDLADWPVHVIEWSPGPTMTVPTFGPKWDQADLTDVDGDGDLDVVANNEEWFVEDDGELTTFDDPRLDPEALGVVWFENRLAEAPWSCAETDDRCVIEAEHATELGDGTWVERTRAAGAVGAYLQAFNARDDGPQRPTDSEGARFQVDVEGGDYDIWIRTLVPRAFGPDLGGRRSDEFWVTVDDGDPVSAAGEPDTGRWTWVPATSAIRLDPGEHDVVVRVRDHGVAFDRLVVAAAGSPEPTGRGPSETSGSE